MNELDRVLEDATLTGKLGIAHTRWATHGVPAENNAHPHICNSRIAIVHNGIIENFRDLKQRQVGQGFTFTSDTDTEVIAHQIVLYLDRGHDLPGAVRATVQDLKGAYALGVIDKLEPDRLVATRSGSPLVVGIGRDENFIASDVQALLKETREFVFLENGGHRRHGARWHPRARCGGYRGQARIQDERPDGRRHGEKRVSPLHAQGDSRAAAGRCRHP